MAKTRRFVEGRHYTSENVIDGKRRDIKVYRRMGDGQVSVSGCGLLAKRLGIEVDADGNESVSLTIPDYEGNHATLVFRA
ncbi:MAG: hypothetical protein LKF00_09025 [Olsenella sp.]|nr:hypothetical protein [Olsenella sp.]